MRLTKVPVKLVVHNMVKQNSGFTLIEITVVLALLALIVGLVIPLYGTTVAKHQLDYAFKQFEEDFFWAQQLAITESTTVEFIFIPAQQQYLLRYRYGENIVIRSLPEGVQLFSYFNRHTLQINRNGNTSQGGRVRFEYMAKETLHTKSYIFQVATGRFRVETFP